MALVALSLLIGPARSARAEPPDWHGRTLAACDDEDGYPPFTIRGPGGKASGYSVDLIEEAIAGTGLRFEVTFLPTKRCTAAIETGTMAMSMEDMWNPDYAATRLTSAPIYAGLYGLYYDKTRHPEGLSGADVLTHPERHHGCGVLGEDYLEFAPGQLDLRAHWIGDAFARVAHGDCEFYPDVIELGGAYPWQGKTIFADPRFGFAVLHLPADTKVPAAYVADDRQKLYFYIRSDVQDGALLIRRIDDTVRRWHATGHDIEVLGHYVDLKALAAAAGRDVASPPATGSPVPP
jgi:hypothetical protein